MGTSIAELRNDMKDSLKVEWMHDAREAMWCKGGVTFLLLPSKVTAWPTPGRGADSSALGGNSRDPLGPSDQSWAPFQGQRIDRLLASTCFAIKSLNDRRFKPRFSSKDLSFYTRSLRPSVEYPRMSIDHNAIPNPLPNPSHHRSPLQSSSW